MRILKTLVLVLPAVLLACGTPPDAVPPPETPDASCTNACPAARSSRCVGSQVQICETGPGGCLAWSEPVGCPAEQHCDPGSNRCEWLTTSPDAGPDRRDAGHPADGGDEQPDGGTGDGGSISDPDGGTNPPDGGCVPTSCQSLGLECGNLFDGCGNIISCGSCASPATCGAGGKPNKCGLPGCSEACQNEAQVCAAKHQADGTVFDLSGCIRSCQDAEAGCSNHQARIACLVTASSCGALDACPSCLVQDPCHGIPTAGQCAGPATVELCVIPTGSGTPHVQNYACPAGEVCSTASGRATCTPTGTCRNGETRCVTPTSLQTCAGGSWTTTTCPGGCAGSVLGASCAANSSTVRRTGTVKYTVRKPNPGRTDWGPAADVPAPFFLVLSFVDGEPFDSTITDAQGGFTVNVPAVPAAGDRLVVFAAAEDDTGGLAYLLADPGFSSPGERQVMRETGSQPRLWSWAWATNAVPQGSTLTITEAMGSGAARVFDLLQASYLKAQTLQGRPGLPLVAWLQFGTTWDCGACFAPYPTREFGLQFDAQVWFSADSNQQYWADAVTGHELGHWVMDSYGTSPQEGGTHYIGNPTFPGQAWSEGFATWFSSDVRNSPVYLDKQRGSMFWLDLSQRLYGSGSPWTRPTPGAGLLQKMDENEVAATLLSLSTAATGNNQRLHTALASTRMNRAPFARGYTRHLWDVDQTGAHRNVQDTRQSSPFLADFLDALMCAGFPAGTMNAATQPATAYPYPSSNPLCSAGSCGPSSCSGCCAGGQCQSGTADAACGSGGAACQACGTGKRCVSGTCTTVTTGEGSTCLQQPDCSSGMHCVGTPASPDTGTCRRSCVPGSGSCGAGYNCLALSASEGACVPAPAANSRWRLVFYSAEIKPLDPASGSAWDVGGGAPDPFVCAWIGAEPGVCSSVKQNTYTPFWNELTQVSFRYADLASVHFNVLDEDLTSNDLVDSFITNLQSPWAGEPWPFEVNRAPISAAGLKTITFHVYPE